MLNDWICVEGGIQFQIEVCELSAVHLHRATQLNAASRFKFVTIDDKTLEVTGFEEWKYRRHDIVRQTTATHIQAGDLGVL